MGKQSNENMIVRWVFTIIFIIIMTCFLIWVSQKADSIKNGATFPEGCWKNYPANSTHYGQIITTYPWSSQCCTRIFTGVNNHVNTYKRVCYDKYKEEFTHKGD